MKQANKQSIDNTVSEQDSQQEHNNNDPLSKLAINGVMPINAKEIEHTLNSSSEDKPLTNGNKGMIQPGQVLNPKGRPKGSLNKISSLFYDDLYNDWQDHGIQAVESMRLDSPTKYCQLVASILPKSLQVETDGTKWVINAQPGLSTSEWLEAHSLPQPIDSQED